MTELISIQFLNGPRAQEKVRLAQFPVVFGRTHDSSVVMDWDGMVSGRHFEVSCAEGAYFLRDAGSRNGTRINGSPVLSQRLYSGDLIEAGSSQLRVILEASIVSTSGSSPGQVTSSQDARLETATENRKRINPFDSGIHHDLAAAPPSPPSPAAPPAPPADSGSGRGQPKATGADCVSPESPFIEQFEPATGSTDLPDRIEQVRIRIGDSSQAGLSAASGSKLFWLAPGQEMTFGRSPRCDCVIQNDSYLSSTHFRLVCGVHECQIEDLGSKSGTCLNSVPIQRAAVFDGDSVLAGRTGFHIEVDGQNGPLVRRSSAGQADPGVRPVEVPIPSGQSMVLTREKCPGEVYVLRGLSLELLPLTAILELIRPLGKVYLLIDFSRCSMPFPDGLDPTNGQLFHWLPPQLASGSLQLVALEELPLWQQYVEAITGTDGLVIFQSQLDKAQVLSGFRRCLGGDPAGKKAFQGMLGICWPSVMAATLQSHLSEPVKQLFATVNLVMLESQDGQDVQVFVSEPKRLDAILEILHRRGIPWTINSPAESDT
jgi:pSer/pThr/pTyr-binding forkhead associated (FHA) protein